MALKMFERGGRCEVIDLVAFENQGGNDVMVDITYATIAVVSEEHQRLLDIAHIDTYNLVARIGKATAKMASDKTQATQNNNPLHHKMF